MLWNKMKNQQIKRTLELQKMEYVVTAQCLLMKTDTAWQAICKFTHNNNNNRSNRSAIVGLMSYLFYISIVLDVFEFQFDCLTNWPKKSMEDRWRKAKQPRIFWEMFGNMRFFHFLFSGNQSANSMNSIQFHWDGKIHSEHKNRLLAFEDDLWHCLGVISNSSWNLSKLLMATKLR